MPLPCACAILTPRHYTPGHCSTVDTVVTAVCLGHPPGHSLSEVLAEGLASPLGPSHSSCVGFCPRIPVLKSYWEALQK